MLFDSAAATPFKPITTADNDANRRRSPSPVLRALKDETKTITTKYTRSTYEKMDFLGKGGAASVYKYREINGNNNNDRLVAVKLFSKNDGHTKEAVLAEARALQRLPDPTTGSLRSVDLAQTDNYLAIVTDLYDKPGTELIDAINTAPEGRLDEPTAKTLMCDMLMQLVAFAAAGYFHGDLSLMNAVVHRGRAVIIDTGRARRLPAAAAAADHLAVDTVVGTPAYQPPEVAAAWCRGDCGYRYGQKSDVFALGVIAIEMLTGGEPYPVQMPDQADPDNFNRHFSALMQHVAAHGVAPDFLRDDCHDLSLSAEAVDFIERATAKSPAARATAQELLDHPWLAATAAARQQQQQQQQQQRGGGSGSSGCGTKRARVVGVGLIGGGGN